MGGIEMCGDGWAALVGCPELHSDLFRVDACDRATAFADILKQPALDGFIPRCFAYDGTPPDYRYGDIRQSLANSASGLGRQMTDLLTEWQQTAGRPGKPEIVVLAHSLGGAVLATWAATASDEMLANVAAITLDSPMRGVPAPQAFFARQRLGVN